ncbi:MAG: sterol desaturase family protein [Nitrospirota bacterium]
MNALHTFVADTRGPFFFASLLLFGLLEIRFGRRMRVDTALRHDAENLLLAALNVALFAAPLSGFVTAYTDALHAHGVGLLNQVDMPLLLHTILLVVCFDGIIYTLHRAYHRIPFLWRFHRVHHTERDLNVTSASRFHPGEILLSTLFRWGIMIPLIGPTGAALLTFDLIYIFMGQFQHSNLRLPPAVESVVRLLFITPDMHHAHHSEASDEMNTNFAVIFSFWDRSFGTYRVEPREGMVIGLAAYRDRKDRTLPALLLMRTRVAPFPGKAG